MSVYFSKFLLNCDNENLSYFSQMVFTVNRKDYCRTLFFHRILISRFSDVEDKLHFNLADFPVDFLMQYVFLW